MKIRMYQSRRWKMKQISKVFIVVGLGIMFLGGMLDADGEKYILLLIAMALGALVALMGVAIMDVETCDRWESRYRACCVYYDIRV